MSFLTHEYMDHDNISIEFANTDTTILTNHHNDKIFESASIIKLPIMIYIYEHLDHEARQEQIDITNKVGGSGVLNQLNIQQLSINDLIYLMIVVSDNSATNTLIQHFGLQHINLFIHETLECTNTNLQRFMMDQAAIDEGKQNTTTAEDMIKILRYITKHEYHNKMLAVMNNQQIHDKVSIYHSFYEDKLTFYSKTGEYANVINEVGIIQHEHQFYYYSFLSNIKNPEKVIKFSHDFGYYIINSILDR